MTEGIRGNSVGSISVYGDNDADPGWMLSCSRMFIFTCGFGKGSTQSKMPSLLSKFVVYFFSNRSSLCSHIDLQSEQTSFILALYLRSPCSISQFLYVDLMYNVQIILQQIQI